MEGPFDLDIYFLYNMLLRACKVRQSSTYDAVAGFKLKSFP